MAPVAASEVGHEDDEGEGHDGEADDDARAAADAVRVEVLPRGELTA